MSHQPFKARNGDTLATLEPALEEALSTLRHARSNRAEAQAEYQRAVRAEEEAFGRADNLRCRLAIWHAEFTQHLATATHPYAERVADVAVRPSRVPHPCVNEPTVEHYPVPVVPRTGPAPPPAMSTPPPPPPPRGPSVREMVAKHLPHLESPFSVAELREVVSHGYPDLAHKVRTGIHTECSRLCMERQLTRLESGLYEVPGGKRKGGSTVPKAGEPERQPVATVDGRPRAGTSPTSPEGVAVGRTLHGSFTATDLGARVGDREAYVWIAEWKRKGWVDTVGFQQYRLNERFGA